MFLPVSWSSFLVPANTTTASKGTATVYAAIPGGADLVRTEARTFVVPRRTQEFSYDYAGNLKSDGLWEYAYDAEDRLVRMETHPDAIGTGMIANADARRLEFSYDYLGRRVQKIVRDGRNPSNGLYASTPIKKDKYLYDGWNLVAEFNALSTLTLVRSYTWGLDLAGSLSATGGVGALLQIYDHFASKTYFPTYDGNGNVASLLDADAGSGGMIAATYEHGPFGEPLRAEVNPTALAADASLATQPFRFSTKFTDSETELVYYGLRYYSATLGRFINRDPIQEGGGPNLYGFASNDGINGWDVLGAFPELVILKESVVIGWRTVADDFLDEMDARLRAIMLTGWKPGLMPESWTTRSMITAVLNAENRKPFWTRSASSTSESSVFKRCQVLAEEMGRMGRQFAETTINNYAKPPTNPMSVSELIARMQYRAGENTGGILSAVTKSAPGAGLLMEAISFMADIHQTRMDFERIEDEPFKAGMSAGFFSSSTLLFVNAWREGRGLTPLLTRTTVRALKGTVAVGIGLMMVETVGLPLIEYSARNTSTPPPYPTDLIRYQWKHGVGPTLMSMSAEFQSLKCAEVLNGR